MLRVGHAVATVLEQMRAAIRPGMTTAALDEVGAAAAKRLGARSAPHLTYGFPGFTCISVNDEIVHGIPGSRALAPGDVVKMDVTLDMDGYIADAARTVLLPPVARLATTLRASAIAALRRAVAAARAGEYVSAIGREVEAQAMRDGFSVLRELCGHGVGRRIHEEPDVPNYEDRLSRRTLTEGLVIAVEPMFSARPTSAVEGRDGWTIRTSNGCLAVHEEHTIVVTSGGPRVLTQLPAG